jgi:hypothetical protein
MTPIQRLFRPFSVIEARKGEPGGRELDALLQNADVVVVPVDAEHVSRRDARTDASARAATPPV